ncbi:hypothetical protein [Gorillibacterium sp. sgz500922]|uniref:hypothetical protein n=1 Tax=Gorillibacterium sp. sgz500922 TaxID=3446694 RepID=UPI003F67ADE5
MNICNESARRPRALRFAAAGMLLAAAVFGAAGCASGIRTGEPTPPSGVSAPSAWGSTQAGDSSAGISASLGTVSSAAASPGTANGLDAGPSNTGRPVTAATPKLDCH